MVCVNDGDSGVCGVISLCSGEPGGTKDRAQDLPHARQMPHHIKHILGPETI